MKKIAMIAAAAIMLLATGCYYDVEEELYPTVECSTDNMSYANDIAPIISQNCYVCHAQALNLGNVTLEGYEAIKVYVDNGKIEGSINHRSGFSAMPQNLPKLLDCEIAKIEQWITDGAPNN